MALTEVQKQHREKKHAKRQPYFGTMVEKKDKTTPNDSGKERLERLP